MPPAQNVAKAERYRGGSAVAKGLGTLLTPETVEPPRNVHAHLADAVTAARWFYPTPNSGCVRILTAACRSPRSRGALCSDSRCNRAFWCARSGVLSVDDIRNGATKACTLLLEAGSLAEIPSSQQSAAVATGERPEETNELSKDS